MAKLNQILAIEKGAKSQAESEVKRLYHAVQKADLFDGMTRSYEKKDDTDDELPSEHKKVQMNVKEVLPNYKKIFSDLYDITARKDWTNCGARADVVVDGNTILKQVPVTYLLFLEKHLTSEIKPFVDALPVLDDAHEWEFDTAANIWKSKPVKVTRTQKIQEPIVLLPQTEHQQGMAQLISKDVSRGVWSTTKHSGAIPRAEKLKIQERVDKLLKAVKMAREEANAADEVEAPSVSEVIFSYLWSQQ